MLLVKAIPDDFKGALKKLVSLSNTQRENNVFLRVVSK